MDKTTGRSKGFVFIKYYEPGVVQKVLGLQHELDGRTVCGCLCSLFWAQHSSLGRLPKKRKLEKVATFELLFWSKVASS